jgi:hypothetical protein
MTICDYAISHTTLEDTGEAGAVTTADAKVTDDGGLGAADQRAPRHRARSVGLALRAIRERAPRMPAIGASRRPSARCRGVDRARARRDRAAVGAVLGTPRSMVMKDYLARQTRSTGNSGSGQSIVLDSVA